MFSNLNIVFFTMMSLSTLISISSTSWIGAWLGLEINLISFIPLITNSKNILCNESALKYFLIQALASSLFLSFCLLNSFFSVTLMEFNSHPLFTLILSAPLMLKLGGAPFQSWFISVMEGLPWLKCVILMTWQKITPILIMSYFLMNNLIISTWATFSLITGAIGGLNHTSLKKIIAFSSINHMGWMLSSFMFNKTLLVLYIILYTSLNIMVISFLNSNMNSFSQVMTSNSPLSFSISLLSLGGLPPLVGFFPKWMIIQSMILNHHFLITFVMIFTALITLFFYIRIIYNNLILSNSLPKWSFFYKHQTNSFLAPSIIMMINIMGLSMFNLLL